MCVVLQDEAIQLVLNIPFEDVGEADQMLRGGGDSGTSSLRFKSACWFLSKSWKMPEA